MVAVGGHALLRERFSNSYTEVVVISPASLLRLEWRFASTSPGVVVGQYVTGISYSQVPPVLRVFKSPILHGLGEKRQFPIKCYLRSAFSARHSHGQLQLRAANFQVLSASGSSISKQRTHPISLQRDNYDLHS